MVLLKNNLHSFHICSTPVWEHDYYWETMYCLSKKGVIDVNNLPSRLKKYTQLQVKTALRYAEKEDKVCERVNIHTWKYKGE
jgi:hypothetical protein